MNKIDDYYVVGDNIKKVFENITDDQIKNLICYITDEIAPNDIAIKELNTKAYYHSNNNRAYTTEDDIYTNGFISDDAKGKIIKDFSVALIVKRNKSNFKVSAIDILINAKDNFTISDIKRELLPMYLTPTMLNFIL